MARSAARRFKELLV